MKPSKTKTEKLEEVCEVGPSQGTVPVPFLHTSLNFHFGPWGYEKIKMTQFMWERSTVAPFSLPRVLEFLIWILELSACSASFRWVTRGQVLSEKTSSSHPEEEGADSESVYAVIQLCTLVAISTKHTELHSHHCVIH